MKKYYKHHTGKVFKVICVSKNAFNCTKERIIIKSLQKTDLPKGTIFDIPKKNFYSKKKIGEIFGCSVEVDRFEKMTIKEIMLFKLGKKFKSAKEMIFGEI